MRSADLKHLYWTSYQEGLSDHQIQDLIHISSAPGVVSIHLSKSEHLIIDWIQVFFSLSIWVLGWAKLSSEELTLEHLTIHWDPILLLPMFPYIDTTGHNHLIHHLILPIQFISTIGFSSMCILCLTSTPDNKRHWTRSMYCCTLERQTDLRWILTQCLTYILDEDCIYGRLIWYMVRVQCWLKGDVIHI